MSVDGIAAGGIFLVVVVYAIGIFILYQIIRSASRRGIEDAKATIRQAVREGILAAEAQRQRDAARQGLRPADPHQTTDS